MTTEFDAERSWERISAELRAQRQAQQKAWGNIDNATLGRYLAGEATPEERRRIESALEELPELRALTAVVRDVLGEVAPAVGPIPPREILSIRASREPQIVRFVRRRAALLAAACLLFAVGLTMPPLLSNRPQAVSRSPLPPDAVAFAAASGRAQAGVQPAVAKMKELDRQLDALERAGQYDSALALAERYPALAKQANLDYRPEFAQRLNRLAHLCQQEDHFDRAEPTLCKVHAICREALGPTHPTTVQAGKSLANIYQVALNAPLSADATTHPVPAPAIAVVTAKDRAEHRRERAVSIRVRISQQNVEELRKSVVPVLSEALQHASTSVERQTLALAIGKLGPAARDAAPYLTSALQKAATPGEEQCLRAALSQIEAATGKIGPTRSLLGIAGGAACEGAYRR